MRSPPRLACALLLLAITPACTIYFGDDDGDDDCVLPGAADEAFAVPLRNPETGVCEDFGGGGGGGGCYGDDRPAGAPQPVPDWGACFSACESLSETECWAAEQCRAVYYAEPCAPDQNGDTWCESPVPAAGFLGCWAIAPSGPAAERVACESLDAYECSRHNDCVANYLPEGGANDAAVFDFVSCGPEPGASGCALLECGPGYHCEETCFPCDSTDGTECPPFCEATCVPDQNQCPILCPPNSECVELCSDCMPGQPDCDPACRWECVPVGPPLTCEDVTCAPDETCEMQCYPGPNGEMGDCRPVCVPTGNSCSTVVCAPGTHCEELCEVPPPCLPNEPCPPPTCGPVCVPDGPPPGCAGLTDEMSCLAAAPLCRPLYTGTCWVNPDGTWVCVDTEFVRCESAAP